MLKERPFIIGHMPDLITPLSRYLPLIPNSVAGQWLAQFESVPQDKKWILDPFGSSPSLVVEAARSGFRILVTANNPISRFLIEMLSSPPSMSDFRSSLAALASSPRGSERLENHIRNLYHIRCLECGAEIEVDAFLWERNATLPYACIYSCDQCSFQGERDLSLDVAKFASEFSSSSLHHARALERVASRDDPDRIFVEEALAVYSPRAIYILFILINKLDGLHLTTNQHRALQALLLSACENATAMWGYPTQRERPRQLAIPPRFRENNIWKTMESAIDLWASPGSSIPVSIWPELVGEDNGVCIYEGPLRDLINLKQKSDHHLPQIQAILTAIPRPNQAFWTLSALWAGWLWGREAVGPFKSVLRRRPL
jgi:hypothetical protein